MELAKLNHIFQAFNAIKLVYLFGSQVNGHAGPLSDYDFAVYLDEKNLQKRGQIKLELIHEFSKTLRTNRIDVVILNDNIAPELKYNIIKEGHLIYEEEPYRVLVEPQILNEYFDFHHSLKKYGLTKAG